MSHRILVGTYTDSIYTLLLDPESHTLTHVASTTVGFHPSWIECHPTDRSVVFAGLEQEDGKVVVVKYEDEGYVKGEVVRKVPSGGGHPCSLCVTEQELFIGNYSSGNVGIYSLHPSAPYVLQESPLSVIQFKGSGPNSERQESSHAHQVAFLPTHKELLVPDLGGDRVYRLRKDEEGTWRIYGSVAYPAGSGPRHVAVHDQNLYTVLELISSVTKHSFPSSSPPDQPTAVLGPKPTLSKPPSDPHLMLAAEILIPSPNKSFPTPFVYVSNRNDPSPSGDTIAVFSESLELVAEVPTGLRHLRGMAFGGPDGRWLVAGGVNGGGVKVFERIDGGVGFKEVASVEVEAPTGFIWV